jgi:hypothetical protein
MDTAELQSELNKLKLTRYPIVSDGVAGWKTMTAVDALLGQSEAKDWGDWVDSRRRVAAEQIIFKSAKIEVGMIDGLVGEQTRYARRVWDARKAIGGKVNPNVELWRDSEANIDVSPKAASHWPRQDQVQSFYGAPGTGWVEMEMPFPLRIAWQPEKTVQKVQVHRKCKLAFQNVWSKTLLHYGYEQLKRLRLDMYGGCGNVRKMRGGSRWSMHSFACAWDIDPDRNQLKFAREQATLDDTAYNAFWAIVEAEGGLSLGRLKNYDWMHFQFTKDLS